MRKPLKILPPLLLLLSLCVLINSQLAVVHASPASARYQASPASHDLYHYASAEAWGNAYDGSNATYVSFIYSSDDSKVPIAYFNMTSFSSLSLPWRIVKVDFKMRYAATVQSSKLETYEIYYRVGTSSPVTLVPATGVAHSIPGAGCDVWWNKPEPNDGVWTWTDVSNIEFVVESPFKRGATGVFTLYEAWVTVTYRAPTLHVDPADQSVSAAFTVDINITNMDDLYSWEFNITYDTTKLTATNVQEGPFLKSAVPPGNTTFGNMIDDTNGWVYAYCSIIGDQAGVTGSGDLANITFSIDASGTDIPLDFNNKTKLIEYNFVSKINYTYLSDTTLCTYPPYYVRDVDGKVTTTLPVPEFPLGGAIEIALATVVIFVWWKRRQKTKPHLFTPKTI